MRRRARGPEPRRSRHFLETVTAIGTMTTRINCNRNSHEQESTTNKQRTHDSKQISFQYTAHHDENGQNDEHVARVLPPKLVFDLFAALLELLGLLLEVFALVFDVLHFRGVLKCQ